MGRVVDAVQPGGTSQPALFQFDAASNYFDEAVAVAAAANLPTESPEQHRERLRAHLVKVSAFLTALQQKRAAAPEAAQEAPPEAPEPPPEDVPDRRQRECRSCSSAGPPRSGRSFRRL